MKSFFEPKSKVVIFVEHSLVVMQTAVLLRVATNKMEDWGSDADSRLKKDKNGALLGTIRTTRVRFNGVCEKWTAAREDLQTSIGQADAREDGLIGFDPVASFQSSSDLLTSELYFDIISHQIVVIQHDLKKHCDDMEPLLQGLQLGGDHFWKADLRADCTMEEARALNVEKMDSLRAVELRERNEGLTKVGTSSVYTFC